VVVRRNARTVRPQRGTFRFLRRTEAKPRGTEAKSLGGGSKIYDEKRDLPPAIPDDCRLKEHCGGDVCWFQQCAAAECEPTQASCEAPAPQCAQGQTPSVVKGCWGPYVPVTSCDPLPDCGLCDRSGLTCVYYTADKPGPRYRCIEPPQDCWPILTPPASGVLACDCAGATCEGGRPCTEIKGALVICKGNPDYDGGE